MAKPFRPMNSKKGHGDTPKRTFQYLSIGTACLAIVSCGMHYGWPSPSLPNLIAKDSPVPMTSDEGSWVVVAMLFGAMCGHSSAALIDKIGRKNVILLTAFPVCVSWVMIAFVKSVPLLITARFIAGAADGAAFAALPMYLSEISDPKIRGFLGSWISISLIAGCMIINNIGSYFDITTTALVALSLPVILVLTFFWMPESPYYLIMKGNFRQARKALELLRGTKDVESELNRLKAVVQFQSTNTGRYFDLFRNKSNWRALYIIVGLRTIQQFSGATAFMLYAQTIFKEAGGSISPCIGSTIYFTIQLVCEGLSSVIVDKRGRRPMLIVSLVGIAIMLLAEGCYFYIQKISDYDVSHYSWISIAVLIVFVIMFSMGMHPIPTIMAGELFPINVKAFAMSFCGNYFCIVVIIATKFFQVTKDNFGMHVPFFVFSVSCFLGIIFVVYFVPETKGKTLEQIQEELGNKLASPKMQEMQTMVEI